MQICSVTNLVKTATPLAVASGPKSLAKEVRNVRSESRTGNMKSQIKLLLVDDHPIVRKGIGSCLSSMRFVANASGGIRPRADLAAS